MPRIHILPDSLASQIAAGEVVERPASVVKELVENSLDAGASEVRLALEAGGKRRIVVEDDGEGMDRSDALLAFDRHATSKIARFEDLEEVATLGFRGEALSSIAAVARVELATARTPGEGVAVRIEGGNVRGVEPLSRPRGTRLEVASLFFNVPARRKFLKTPATELRRCVEVVQGCALARPDVGFRLEHERRQLLDAQRLEDGSEGTLRRIESIFGGELAADLVEIPRTALTGGTVWGYVGSPETSGRRRLFVFVNRRLVRDRAVLATFYRSVRDEWRSEDFPALFLFLDLDPRSVDVNVHPQKAEVRFREPRLLDAVAGPLRAALRGGLAAGGLSPRPAGRGDWPGAPGWIASPGWVAGSAAGTVAEAGRLAAVAYAPLERTPVPLSGRSGETRPFRLLGQYKGTLILLEGPDGLYLVDQHVAHERLLYERLRRQLEESVPARQELLEPILLDLSRAERMRLQEMAAELEECGFSLRELSGEDLALTAVPAVLAVDEAHGLVVRLAGSEAERGEGAAGMRGRILDSLAADASCQAAVKMHEPLTAREMESLVEELFRAEQPYACPHGRPIVLKMTDADLESRFGRR